MTKTSHNITIKDFLSFLKDNDAYSKYVYNLRRSYRLCTLGKLVHLSPKSQKPMQFIIGDFNWNFTKEGTTYWFNLYIKWSMFIQLKNEL